MKSVIRSTVLAATLLTTHLGHAAPILGDKLYYQGGSIDITILSTTAGYSSLLSLYLLNPQSTQQVFGWNHSNLGQTYSYDPATQGYVVGDELIFGIYVQNTGNTFFMGDASRNPDHLIHASVDSNSGSGFDYLVGFEDLFNGGDQDYDDNVFGFSGGLSSNPTPVSEPGSLLLLATGLLALTRRRLR